MCTSATSGEVIEIDINLDSDVIYEHLPHDLDIILLKLLSTFIAINIPRIFCRPCHKTN